MRAWTHDGMTVGVHANTDWGKGPQSTSGGMMMVSGTVLKNWSRTEVSRALSTAEAEDYAVVPGAAEGLGRQSMMTDMGGR